MSLPTSPLKIFSMVSQDSSFLKTHESLCMTDPSLPLQLISRPWCHSLYAFAVLVYFQVFTTCFVIFVPLFIFSLLPEIPFHPFFYEINFYSSLETFPRGLPWYHFPSPRLSRQISCPFSVLPQYTEHALVRASVGWFSNYPCVLMFMWMNSVLSIFSAPLVSGSKVRNAYLLKWSRKLKRRLTIFT